MGVGSKGEGGGKQLVMGRVKGSTVGGVSTRTLR